MLMHMSARSFTNIEKLYAEIQIEVDKVEQLLENLGNRDYVLSAELSDEDQAKLYELRSIASC